MELQQRRTMQSPILYSAQFSEQFMNKTWIFFFLNVASAKCLINCDYQISWREKAQVPSTVSAAAFTGYLKTVWRLMTVGFGSWKCNSYISLGFVVQTFNARLIAAFRSLSTPLDRFSPRKTQQFKACLSLLGTVRGRWHHIAPSRRQLLQQLLSGTSFRRIKSYEVVKRIE